MSSKLKTPLKGRTEQTDYHQLTPRGKWRKKCEKRRERGRQGRGRERKEQGVSNREKSSRGCQAGVCLQHRGFSLFYLPSNKQDTLSLKFGMA